MFEWFKDEYPALISLRYLLTPVTIDWRCMTERSYLGASTTQWKGLYVFGIRIAVWRAFEG